MGGTFVRFLWCFPKVYRCGEAQLPGVWTGASAKVRREMGSNAATWDLETLRIWKSNMDIFFKMMGFRLRIFPSYHGGILLAVHASIFLGAQKLLGCTRIISGSFLELNGILLGSSSCDLCATS